MRRFNFTKLVASGVDLGTVMNRVGHSSPQVTLALYAQADRAADEEAARTRGSDDGRDVARRAHGGCRLADRAVGTVGLLPFFTPGL